VQDSDAITVSVVNAPLAGSITPASYHGSSAGAATALTYTHTAGDLSEDSVTLAVSDGVNQAVLVTAAITVRLRPDRVSIISDPLFEVTRGQPVSRSIRTVPSTNVTLTSLAYGHPLPPLCAGVVLTGSILSIDWSLVPSGTTWLALSIQAVSSDLSFIPASRRTALQPMLIHVLDAAPVGAPN